MNIILKITILKEIYIFDNLRIKMMKNFYSSFKFLILLDANQKLNPQIKQIIYYFFSKDDKPKQDLSPIHISIKFNY